MIEGTALEHVIDVKRSVEITVDNLTEILQKIEEFIKEYGHEHFYTGILEMEDVSEIIMIYTEGRTEFDKKAVGFFVFAPPGSLDDSKHLMDAYVALYTLSKKEDINTEDFIREVKSIIRNLFYDINSV